MRLVTDGRLTRVDGSPALAFAREFGHPVAAVWDAIVDPTKNVRWYPAQGEFELRSGGAARFTWEATADGADPEVTFATILEAEPPGLLSFDEDGDVARFELSELEEARCALEFTHILPSDDHADRTAAGWHQCLDALAAVLDAKPYDPLSESQVRALREGYRRAFASA
jgi:uncharacterized protein YndB with AHSA1/START domain